MQETKRIKEFLFLIKRKLENEQTQLLQVGYFFIFLNLPQQFQSNFNSQTAIERFFFNILSIGVYNVLTTNN